MSFRRRPGASHMGPVGSSRAATTTALAALILARVIGGEASAQ